MNAFPFGHPARAKWDKNAHLGQRRKPLSLIAVVT
jgi:hypothetical protein